MMNTATTVMDPAPAETDTLPILEWEGVRVVTTTTLAKGYGTADKNITMNLSNNSKRFAKGTHYFHVVGSKLKEFKNYTNDIGVVDKRARQLFLWTEKGAARMSKIVDTDQAWEFFEKLEDAYFRPRQATQSESPDVFSAMK